MIDFQIVPFSLVLTAALMMGCTTQLKQDSKRVDSPESSYLPAKPYMERIPFTRGRRLSFSNGMIAKVQERDDFLPNPVFVKRGGKQWIWNGKTSFPADLLNEMSHWEIFQLSTLPLSGRLITSLEEYRRTIDFLKVKQYPDGFSKFKFRVPNSLSELDFKPVILKGENEELKITFTGILVERIKDDDRCYEYRNLSVSKLSFTKSPNGPLLFDSRDDFLVLPAIDVIQTTTESPSIITDLWLLKRLGRLRLIALPLLDKEDLDELKSDPHTP